MQRSAGQPGSCAAVLIKPTLRAEQPHQSACCNRPCSANASAFAEWSTAHMRVLLQAYAAAPRTCSANSSASFTMRSISSWDRRPAQNGKHHSCLSGVTKRAAVPFLQSRPGSQRAGAKLC